jgi:hypothetical protein
MLQNVKNRLCFVLGYTDPAARANMGGTIPENMFTFAVPSKLFVEMEEEARDGSSTAPSGRASLGRVKIHRSSHRNPHLLPARPLS